MGASLQFAVKPKGRASPGKKMRIATQSDIVQAHVMVQVEIMTADTYGSIKQDQISEMHLSALICNFCYLNSRS